MSRFSMALAALFVALACQDLAAQNNGLVGFESVGGALGVPQPSGLRFASVDVPTVRTGSVSGGYGAPVGPGGPCNACMFGGCIDWKLMPWYGVWPSDGFPPRHYCRRCNNCN